MKIAFLSVANSVHIPARTNYFVDKGYEVYYFAIHPGTELTVKPRGVKCIDISSDEPDGYVRRMDKIFQVRRLTEEFGIDILHIIDMGYCLYAPFSKSKKVVIENNGSDVLLIPKILPERTREYGYSYKFADAIVQDSEIAKAAGMKLGASEKNNEVIELGIDFNCFNLDVEYGVIRKKLNLTMDEKIVVSPRGFTELYNIDVIIKSIPLVKREFNNVKYIFCRNASNKEDEYLKLIKELDVEDNVIFLGFLDNENELPYLYKDSNVMVSIPTSDSSPRSVYEAMSCGTPVIISEHSWYKGKLEEGKDLLVVKQKNVEDLSQKIISTLKNEHGLNLKDIYEKVKIKLNRATHSERLEKLYKKILNDEV